MLGTIQSRLVVTDFYIGIQLWPKCKYIYMYVCILITSKNLIT